MNIEADVRESVEHLMHQTGTDTEKFRYLGSGLYRRAWLHRESGKVIKIGDKGANAQEVENSHRLLKEPSIEGKCRIPKVVHLLETELYYMGDHATVIMAEYVDGEPSRCSKTWSGSFNKCDCGRTPCSMEVREKLVTLTNIGDLHADNVLVKDDEYWIVDLGM